MKRFGTDMASEKTLWYWFKKGVRGYPGLHMVRAENSVNQGYPDVDGCYEGRAFKIELKRVKALTFEDRIKIKFQPMQQLWLKKRWSVGGFSWLLIALGEGRGTRRFLVRGCDVDGLEDCSISHLEGISVIAENAKPIDILEVASGGSFS